MKVTHQGSIMPKKIMKQLQDKVFSLWNRLNCSYLIIFILLLALTLPSKAIMEDNSDVFMPRSYVLGPNDVFSIMVYDFPEFNQQDIRVAPDGTIVLASLGVFNVSGCTLVGLHDLVRAKLLFYLKDPQVTIKLEKIKPMIVYINGAVQNPGPYELSIDATNNINSQKNESNVFIERRSPLLSNILTAAGGINYNADLENIKIKNSYDKSEVTVNLLELLEGNTNQDIRLMYNDVVYVPELPTSYAVSDKKYKKYASAVFSPKKVPVKILGYVNKPGLIYLSSSDALNLNAAISSAGGYFNDTPYPPKKVYVSRVNNDGKLTTTVVNPMENDLMLRPNDIVYVPDKSRPIIGRAFDYLNRLINPSNNFSSSYNNWATMFNPTRNQK